MMKKKVNTSGLCLLSLFMMASVVMMADPPYCKADLLLPIDIKPNDARNIINMRSHGNIPVAILGNPTFDVVNFVDRTSLTFGASGDEPSLDPSRFGVRDVNRDNLPDLICYFEIQLIGFTSGDTVGILKGMLLDGNPFQGEDSVIIRGGAEGREDFVLLSSVTVDGGSNGDDQPRGLALDEDGNVYVTGYVSVPGQGKNIWLAKYDSDLVLLDSITIDGLANGDDEGYTIALDGNGYLYVIGYMTEEDEDHNVWLAKFDTDLVPQGQITENGSNDSTDDGYGILYDGAGYLYVAGTLTQTDEGNNIWIAKYNTNLVLQTSTILNGPGNGTDKGRFLALDGNGNLFVSGSATPLSSRYAIWLGKFDIDLNLQDDLIIEGTGTGEDKGYGLVFDGIDTLYVTGTMTESTEGYNIWLAKYDTDLNPIRSITLNDPVDGEDVSYSIVLDDDRYIYQIGDYTEAVGGTNIWIARYNKNLQLRSYITIDGPAGGYDSGFGVIRGIDRDIYVTGIISDAVEGPNIWIARYRVSRR